MKPINLSKLADGQLFIRSKRTKIVYKVIQKEKGGVLVSAVLSDRSFTLKGKTKVYIGL